MALPIVHYNSPILRERGKTVDNFDAGLSKLAQEMIETLHGSEGIGLAAQQVGHAIQLCVLDLRATDLDFDWTLDGAHPPAPLFMPFAVVNPKITVMPGTDYIVHEEGCLSFPGLHGDVERPDRIEVSYQDQFGVPHQLLCNGMLSRCVQHETDHLNGTLYIDRMTKSSRMKIEKAIKELAKRTREESKKV
jgi:peptide deformylase